MGLGWIPLILLVFSGAQAADYWDGWYGSLHRALSRGEVETEETYLVEIAKLRPTQATQGLGEVRSRQAKMREMDRGALADHIEEKTGEVIIGPRNEIWLLDGHHMASALLRNGERHMLVSVSRDWSRIPTAEFFHRMVAGRNMWLYDENGQGPLDPDALPRFVLDLRDDPYRTLAWRVRKAGGYRKTQRPFAEFQWAEFFRARIPADELKNWRGAVSEGLRLARAPEARGLPGYKGRTRCTRLLVSR
jgi:hypothetical protein